MIEFVLMVSKQVKHVCHLIILSMENVLLENEVIRKCLSRNEL